MIPTHGKLYLCRYGFNGGQQVCLFVGYAAAEATYIVRKWRANSGRWTDRLQIRAADLLAPACHTACRKHQVDVSRL